MCGMNKILVIRFSSIGDIVLTTPVLRCIHHAYPSAEIHYLTKKAFVPLLKANPYISKIHAFEGDLMQSIVDLRKIGFDAVVDLHRSMRSRLLCIGLGKTAGGFIKLNARKWLLVHTKRDFLPDIHIVDRYFNAAKAIKVQNDHQGLDYFLPQDEKINLTELPEAFHQKFIAVVIGAKHTTKQIPEALLVKIIQKLPHPIVLMGGPEDRVKAEGLCETLSNSMIFNACGGFSINQSADLIRRSSVVLTADTGLMHIAAAFQKKIVSVWGNTVPQFGMTPYMPQNELNSVFAEVRDLKCRPCSKIGFKKCPKGHFNCMMQQDADQIVLDVLRLFHS